MSITLERLRVPVTLQADGTAKGRIVADASVYNVVSATGHRIHAGAFQASLDTRGLPMLSWEHAWELGPIGTILDMQDGPNSLRYTAQLYLESDLSNRIHQAIVGNNIRDNSFAFEGLDVAEVTVDGETVYEVTKANLFEACLCVVGANEMAGVISAQSLLDPDADAKLEAALDRIVVRQREELAAISASEQAEREAAALLRQVDMDLLAAEPWEQTEEMK